MRTAIVTLLLQELDLFMNKECLGFLIGHLVSDILTTKVCVHSF